MKKLLALFCLLSVNIAGFSQNYAPVPWERAITMPVDSVFAIDASHLKWDSIPGKLYEFRHLRYLDLSKNRLTALPERLGDFTDLHYFSVSKNKLTEFPTVICKMTKLDTLSVSRNMISYIPECISTLDAVTYLDLWDNPLKGITDAIGNMASLKKVDLRGILFNERTQTKWRTGMPQVSWLFDLPCTCIE